MGTWGVSMIGNSIIFGNNTPCTNPDSYLLAAMGNEINN